MDEQQKLIEALHAAQSALDLIAAPARADGTYNRDRRACELLAREALGKVSTLLNPPQPVDNAVHTATGMGPFVVFTDGACHHNPGPAGWGVVVLEAGEVKAEASGYIGLQTNQIAELVAAIEGLSRVPKGAHVELVSDSQYTLKGLTEWRAGWERKGMRTASGEPVKNLTYWKQLYALADERKVTTRWVKGHNGDQMNERCDALATAAVLDGKAKAFTRQ